MPIFGWIRTSSDDDLPQQEKQRQQQQQQQHVALPPPDPSVLELEELLAQAKVGTHEFSYVSSPTTKQHHQQQQNQQQHHQSEQYGENQELRPENIPLPLSDDGDESSTERENVVNLEDFASSSSEESGVFVDPPSDPNTTTENTAEQESAATQDLVVVIEKKRSVAQQGNTTLAVFQAPKLHFFTDEGTIPVQLQHVQQQSRRKRHEFQTRIHDLECKVAQLTAKLAEESMDLDLDLRNAMETGVYKPLEAAFETISFNRYASTASSLTQQWMMLERRLSALDSQMTHSLHVQLQDLKRNHLTSLRDELDQDVLPELQAESIAADKRETCLARRWESHVGTMSRRFAEERATRVAALTVADSKLREVVHPNRAAEMLAHVAALRKQLEHERAERIAQDERIRSFIVERVESMKQAILEAHPDPDTY